jgi:hypothetical protein
MERKDRKIVKFRISRNRFAPRGPPQARINAKSSPDTLHPRVFSMQRLLPCSGPAVEHYQYGTVLLFLRSVRTPVDNNNKVLKANANDRSFGRSVRRSLGKAMEGPATQSGNHEFMP